MEGERLPPERDLADGLGVSRMTVRQALASLAARGLVERGVGRGTFVARVKLDHDLGRVAGFSELMARQGLEAGAQLISAGECPAPRRRGRGARNRRGRARGTASSGVRFGAGVPLAIEDSWIPAAPFPGLLQGSGLTRSLYALMRDLFGLEPVRAVERLEPVVARPHEAAALEVAPGPTADARGAHGLRGGRHGGGARARPAPRRPGELRDRSGRRCFLVRLS